MPTKIPHLRPRICEYCPAEFIPLTPTQVACPAMACRNKHQAKKRAEWKEMRKAREAKKSA